MALVGGPVPESPPGASNDSMLLLQDNPTEMRCGPLRGAGRAAACTVPGSYARNNSNGSYDNSGSHTVGTSGSQVLAGAWCLSVWRRSTVSTIVPTWLPDCFWAFKSCLTDCFRRNSALATISLECLQACVFRGNQRPDLWAASSQKKSCL